MKTVFPRYGDSHVKDKTVVRPSYLLHGDTFTGKTTSLYWDGPQAPMIFSSVQFKNHLIMLDSVIDTLVRHMRKLLVTTIFHGSLAAEIFCRFVTYMGYPDCAWVFVCTKETSHDRTEFDQLFISSKHTATMNMLTTKFSKCKPYFAFVGLCTHHRLIGANLTGDVNFYICWAYRRI